jgi:predicted enzyme related to lactoylglutathione lyase
MTTQQVATPTGHPYRMIGRADGGHAGGVLTLTPEMQMSGGSAAWIPYFDVDNVPATVAKAQGLGAQVWLPPMTMDQGTMAMLGDPQGASFYLMAPTPPADRPDAVSDVFKPNAPGHCWWNELETNNEPGATAFYTALFGWKADNTMPMGDRGDYRFIEQDGPLGAINPWLAEYMRVGWVPYFGVADIAAAHDAAKANGGTVHQDIHEVPGGDQIFIASDPAGALVGFVGKKGA